MSALLEIRSLSAGYGRYRVLEGVDMSVDTGGIVAVVGPNGAGKSTLLRTVSGIADQFGGRITFAGEDLSGVPAYRRTRMRLMHVPEGRHLFPDLTVEQNLKVASAHPEVRADRKTNLRRMAELFPALRRRWTVLAGSLSGGEQQMVAIARALMGNPRLLMVDEPSLGLAPKVADEIYERLVRLATQGLALLIVEQNVTQSFQVAEHAYILERGMVALSGPTRELISDDRVAGIYLGESHV